MTAMLVEAAERSDRPKRQLFINPRTEGDSLLPAQFAAMPPSRHIFRLRADNSRGRAYPVRPGP